MDQFVLKIAESDEERMGAYKLRFQCLTLEGGDDNHTDFEKKLFKDSVDNSDHSRLLVAIDAATSMVVSTQRITFRRDIPFIADHIYPYDKIANVLGCSVQEAIKATVLHDRSSTQVDYRMVKPSLFVRLYQMAEEIIKNQFNGIAIVIGFVNVNNEKVLITLKEKCKWSYLDGGGWNTKARSFICCIRSWQPRA